MVLLEHRAFIKKSFDSQKLSKIVMETTRIYSIFSGVLPWPPYLWGPTLPPVCLPPNQISGYTPVFRIIQNLYIYHCSMLRNPLQVVLEQAMLKSSLQINL